MRAIVYEFPVTSYGRTYIDNFIQRKVEGQIEEFVAAKSLDDLFKYNAHDIARELLPQCNEGFEKFGIAILNIDIMKFKPSDNIELLWLNSYSLQKKDKINVNKKDK